MRGAGATRIAPIGLLILVVAGALAVSWLGDGAPRGEQSARSLDPGGRYVAWRLAAELGFEPELWRGAPGELPRGPHTLVLFAAPEDPPGYRFPDESDPAGAGTEPAAAEPAFERRLRDPLHYVRFLDAGGTLLAGWSPEMRSFLIERLNLRELEGLESLEEAATVLLDSRSGEELRVAALPVMRATAGVADLERDLIDPTERPFLVRAPVGRGAVAVVASTDPFTHESIGDEDHSLLWVRLLERVHAGGTLYIDEYAAGGWVPESPLALAFSPAYRLASTHLILLLLLVAWLWSSGGAFPREEEGLARASALARVRAHAAFLARSGSWHLAARILARDTLAVLEGRARRAVGTEDAREAGSSATRVLSGRVDRALASSGARLGGPEELARARSLLLEARARNANELTDHARALALLERKMAPSEARRSADASREGRGGRRGGRRRT